MRLSRNDAAVSDMIAKMWELSKEIGDELLADQLEPYLEQGEEDANFWVDC